MVKLIGLLGGLCFAYCGVPSAYKTWKAKQSIGTPVSIAWMITIGAILMYTYLLLSYGFDLLLLVNYLVEAVSWGLMIYYHYNPKRKD